VTTPQPSHWNPAAADEPSHLRRNVLLGMSTLSVVVLAMGYHTSLDAQSAATTATSSTTASTSGGRATGTAAQGSTGTAANGSGSSGASAGTVATLQDGTYTGTSVSTRWGPVQVRIVVSGGKITSSQAVVYPQENNRDVQINSRAVPTYNAEVVQAQSAQIDAISGATVTWQGYTGSLQSALDQARA